MFSGNKLSRTKVILVPLVENTGFMLSDDYFGKVIIKDFENQLGTPAGHLMLQQKAKKSFSTRT